MALPKYKTSRANTHSRRSQWKAVSRQMTTVRTPEGENVTVPQYLAAAARKGKLKL
jgi:large subunit ribosomal protein L32